MKTFEKNQQVVCVASHGYCLTTGKVYSVVEYMPPIPADSSHGFTWPAYVTVVDDFGKEATGHAYRFKPID